MPQNLYNANDGLTGRDGGPYLDLEEARVAEVKRATIEGREPDFENMPASAGIQLVTAGQALANAGVVNLPSQADNKDAAEAALQGVVDDPNNSLKVHSVIEEAEYTEPVVTEPVTTEPVFTEPEPEPNTGETTYTTP